MQLTWSKSLGGLYFRQNTLKWESDTSLDTSIIDNVCWFLVQYGYLLKLCTIKNSPSIIKTIFTAYNNSDISF